MCALLIATETVEPTTYKFRAECDEDVLAYKELVLKEDKGATFEMTQAVLKGAGKNGEDVPIPDTDITLVSKLPFIALLCICSEVEDGHVMLETMATADKYTGDRDYGREDRFPIYRHRVLQLQKRLHTLTPDGSMRDRVIYAAWKKPRWEKDLLTKLGVCGDSGSNHDLDLFTKKLLEDVALAKLIQSGNPFDSWRRAFEKDLLREYGVPASGLDALMIKLLEGEEVAKVLQDTKPLAWSLEEQRAFT